MIKKIVLSVFLFFFVFSSYGQSAFNKGDMGINLGMSLGSINDKYYPAANASFEMGFFPIGKKAGVISIGAYSDMFFTDDGMKPTLSARGIFHLGFLNTKKFDVYGGLGTGFGLYEDGEFYFEEFAGGRIMLKDNFGIFAEVGWGASNLKAGICWILQ